MEHHPYPPPFTENRVQHFLRTRIYPLNGAASMSIFVGSFVVLYSGAWVLAVGLAESNWPLAVVGLVMVLLGVAAMLSPMLAISAHGRLRHHEHLVRMADIWWDHDELMQRLFAARGMQYSAVDNTGHEVIQGEVVDR